MRILLLHPEDSPLEGPWLDQPWDAAFDLGRGGWAACERWSRKFGCPVKPIDRLRDGYAEVRRVGEVLQQGLGRLVDKEGLDWWELTAMFAHSQLESLILVREFADDLPRNAEIWITRDGFEADALRLFPGTSVHVIPSAVPSRKGLKHYWGRLSRLPRGQVLQILGDKYDAGYRVRRHLHRRESRSEQPVVLLPSSYINMSLTGTAYARLVPDTPFLLVSTRQSGRLREVPNNVKQAWLASYAGDFDPEECREILKKWAGLKKEIEAVPELAALARLGLMDDFPQRFADGLAIRNAWLGVLDNEPVQAVFCSDDSNPHTHIPLLLAKKRGLPTIACHHGALDGRHFYKRNHAEVILAKGRMEQDYLVRTCGVDPAVVEIGAPSVPDVQTHAREQVGDSVVFFSEPYETTAGRTEEIYRDVFPGLVDLAKKAGKRLVVKLHPSEDLSGRQKLMGRVLTREQESTIQWLTGSLGSELLQRTWFGVTVQSSIVLECIVHGVPCFVCDWLDLWPYGYITQYKKFGVAMGLRGPEEIASIPEKLAAWRLDPGVVADCWQAIAPERFEEILEGRRTAGTIPVRMQRA